MLLSRVLNYVASKSTLRGNLLKRSVRFASEGVSGPVMGIDLGTTNSCVAIMEGSDPRVIVNAEGHRTTPSVVAFTDENTVLVGEPAKRQAVTNSKNTIYGTKRLIGRAFDDSEVQKEQKHLPFDLAPSSSGSCFVKCRGKEYSPSQIGSYVLTKMKDTACSYLGLSCNNAVITVPAYFNDSQRQATKDAGKIAGLNVVRIINEPTAAALAYGLQKKDMRKTIVVYDLGGGTFDVSVLEVNDGVFEVKSTNGDTRLGGEDFDNVIMKYLVENINKTLRTDVTQDLKALQRVREAAEKLKIELSHTIETEVNLPYIIGANSYSAKFTRSQLEGLVSGLVDSTIPPCKQALKDAGLDVKQIDEVLLVGGMTRMPKVQRVVKDHFGKEPCKNVNPDEAVAMGAAIQGGIMAGQVSGILLVDVTPFSLGCETVGDVFVAIIEKNTVIPTRKSQTFTTAQDNQTSVNISVFQGNRAFCRDNTPLGTFHMGPFPARPKGLTQIEVTYELDNNGICKVFATDTASGVKVEGIVRSNPSGLSKEELDRMSKEAESYREEDEKNKKLVMARNDLEGILNDLRNMKSSSESNLPAEEAGKMQNLIESIEEILKREGANKPTVQDYHQRLNEALNDLTRWKRLIEKKADQTQQTDSSAKTTNEEETKTG